MSAAQSKRQTLKLKFTVQKKIKEHKKKVRKEAKSAVVLRSMFEHCTVRRTHTLTHSQTNMLTVTNTLRTKIPTLTHLNDRIVKETIV